MLIKQPGLLQASGVRTWMLLGAKKICSPYCSQNTRASVMHQAPTDTDSVPSSEKNIRVWWCIRYVTAQ